MAKAYEKLNLLCQVCMNYFVLTAFIVFTGCNNNVGTHQNTAPAGTPLNVTNKCQYEEAKKRCKTLYTTYNQSPHTKELEQLQYFFTDSLLPCWYGTPWDYNGTADTPGNGKIACGYFITTTLQHAGVSINRVKMAQCASSELIRNTCTHIHSYSNVPITDFIEKVKKDGAGLYIAGLDFHTGFLFFDGTETYFIHASFYGSRNVVKETAATCAVLRNSKLRVTGKVNFRQ